MEYPRNQLPTIRASLVQMLDLADRIEKKLPAGWSRDEGAEQLFLQRSPGRRFEFERELDPNGPKGHFGIRRVNKDEWQGAQPTWMYVGDRAVSDAEAGQALAEFSQAIQSAASNAGLTVELRSEKWRRDHIPIATLERWKEFVQAADRRSLTWREWRDWNAFAVQAFEDAAEIDDDSLEQWLEENGFEESLRPRMVESFRQAQSVLSVQEEMRERA